MKLAISIPLVGIAILLSACSKDPAPPAEQSWLTMGTFASVTVRSDDAEHLAYYHETTSHAFDELNQLLSVYLPDSEISQLNGSTGMVAISQETLTMLQETVRYAHGTSGAFDPTVSPLIQLWGFSGGSAPSGFPAAEIIAGALEQTGYQHLKLSPASPLSSMAGFDRPGMSIDLGGIAKGFAVDRAYGRLTETRPANALINLGGNIRCHGKATPERPWRIGVRHPFDTSLTIGALTMQSGMAVATSGNYERFVTIDGERYAHIVDPRTGCPVKGMAGVTALSTSATEADALSTALFVVGIEGAPALLKALPTTHALLVPDRTPMEIWVSPGFQEVFTPHPEYADAVRLLGN
ncbi:MAG: FAD:protein FMN transferase [Verrucomicrobia bacterium]|jgi:FAD:protein FMN transferase|nr:FAD:protein FMN transferase [Verrucomicrobiota bacterium]